MKKSCLRVLVVDDEPAIRTVLCDLLMMEGYEVLSAQNGIDALRRMVEPFPNVVISDLRMPVMSGYEFMSVLRHRFPQIPVIAVSGEYRTGEMPDHVPADAFLAKGSYLIAELCQLITELECVHPIRPPTSMHHDLPVPIDAHGNLLLQCPNCLRPVQKEALGLNGGFHTAQCASCQTFIKFQIDHQHKSKKLQVVQSGTRTMTAA